MLGSFSRSSFTWNLEYGKLGTYPSLTVCQTPLFLFPLSATCWRMKLLSVLSIMWSAFFFICSKISSLRGAACGEGAWQRHGLMLQTHPLVEGSQAAHHCAHYPHFPIVQRMWIAACPLVSGCSGILDMDMICNPKHTIAVHYAASVETNCAPKRVSLSAPAALKLHPVKSRLCFLWPAAVGGRVNGKDLGAKWRVLFYLEYFLNWSSSFVRKILLIYVYSYSSPNTFLCTHIL